MAGLRFDTYLNYGGLAKSADAIKGIVNKTMSAIKQASGSVGDFWNKITDGGQSERFERRSQQIVKSFNDLVNSMGLASDAANDVSDRVNKAMNDMANSTENPKKKFENLKVELSKILDDIRDMKAPIGEGTSNSEVPALKERLEREKEILDVLTQQRDVAAEGFKRNKEKLTRQEDILSQKYNGQSESFYSEADLEVLNRGREATLNWAMAWEDANEQVDKSKENIDGLEKKIGELENVYKGFADSAESASTKIFISEGVMQEYENLKGKIAALKTEISTMPDDDIDLPKLRQLQEDLASSQEQFRALDYAARHTAEVLGDDLAKKVSAALNNLYTLNASVRANAASLEMNEEKLKALKEEMSKSDDPVFLKKARKEADALQESIDAASDNLSKYKALQKDAVDKIEKLKDAVESEGKSEVSGVGEQAVGVVKNIAAIAGIGFGLNELKDFFSQAKEWRSYFQDIESSMKVFLGSAEKGTEFTEKLKDYAYYNMFEFSDLAAASQQMISYGHDVESIIPRLDQLSNVATGTHGSLMELVDAYNRAKATGVVDARGVQSWAVKGVMIRDVLRDMGETATGTSITFEQLNRVLDKVTGEGGQFHNLMLEMMDNISAEEGQLEDNLATMFSAIGEKYEGVFIKFLKLQSELADNYEDIGGGILDWGAEAANAALDELAKHWRQIVDVVKDAIVIYGSYKVAAAAVSAYHKVEIMWKEAEAVASRKAMSAKMAEAAAEATETAAKVQNTAQTAANSIVEEANAAATSRAATAKIFLAKANKALGLSMLTNPYSLVAVAITAIAYACYSAYDSMLTHAEAQRMLTKAAEEYKDTLKENEQEQRKNIGIIQNKTASLVEQTRAYKDLTKASSVFSQYTLDEISKMTSEQVNSLFNKDSEKRMEDYYQNQIKALEKFKEKYGESGAAWLHDPKSRLKHLAEEFDLGEDWAEKISEKIGKTTDLSDFAEEALKTATEQWHDELAKKVEDGLVNGFKNGFSNPKLKESSVKMINDFSNKMESQTAYLERRLFEERERAAKAEHNIQGGFMSDNKTADYKTLDDARGNIEKLSKKLENVRRGVTETFKKTLQPQVDEANERVVKLNKELANTTGDKRTEIEAKLKGAQNDLDTLNGMMQFFEESVTNKTLIVGVQSDINDIILGDDKLIEIGDKYSEIDDMAVKMLNGIDAAREEMMNMSVLSQEEAEEIAEKYGLTAESIQENFGVSLSNVEEDLRKLNKQLEETTDPEERDKIILEIAEKEKLKEYISNIKTQLEEATRDPYNLRINVIGKAEKWLKDLLRAAGYTVGEEKADGNSVYGSFNSVQSWGASWQKRVGEEETVKPRTNSEKAKEKAKNAKERQKKEDEPHKFTGAEWKQKDDEGKRKRIRELQDKLKGKLTKKEYDDIQRELSSLTKGSTKKQGKDIQNRNAKEIADRLKHAEEMRKLETESRRKQEDAAIAGIKNQAEREREERRVQYERTIEDLKQKETDVYKAIYDRRKSEYERKNKDKKYENTKEGAAGWATESAQASMKASFTKDEAKQYNLEVAKLEADSKKATEERQRQLKEEHDKQVQYLRDYIKEYGSIQQQKEVLYEEYAEKIDEADGDAQKAMLARQRDDAVKALDFKQLQRELNWEEVFGDLDRLSTDALMTLRENLRTALDAKDITVENAKVIAEKINELDDKIVTRTDAWSAFLPLLRERKRLISEAVTAEKTYQSLLAKQMKKQADKAGVQVQAGATLLRYGLDTKDLSLEGIKKIMNTLNPTSEAFKELEKISKELAVAETDLATATDEASQAQQNANTKRGEADAFNFFKGAYKKGVDAAGGEINFALQQATELNELIDAIGLHDTEFGKGVKEFTDGANHFASAAQKLQSGDFVGAITDTVLGVQDFGHLIERIGQFSFNGSNAAETMRSINNLAARNDALKNSMDAINSTISKGTGLKAIKAYEDSVALQKELNDNIAKQLELQVGYHNAHHSFENYWEGFSQEELDRISKSSGKTFSGDWGELTPEQARAIIQNADLAQRIQNTGEGGYGQRVYEYIEMLAAQADILTEKERELQETLTNTSFDGMRSSFLDTLMDMESDSETFGNNIGKIMYEALLNNFVLDDTFTDWLEDWMKRYSEAMKITDAEERAQRLADLKENAQQELDLRKKQAKEISDAIGYEDILDNEKAKSAAESMMSTWKSMLTDMESDTEDFSKQFAKMMFEDIIEKQVLGKEFLKWLTEWQKEYQEALETGNTDRLNDLNETAQRKREELAKDVKAYMEAFGIVESKFDDLRSSFVSILTDTNTDAEQWGKKIKETLLNNLINAFIMNGMLKGKLEELENYLTSLFDKDYSEEDIITMATQAINEFIPEAEKAEKYAENLRKSLGLDERENPFSNLKQSFKDALSDMSMDAETFRTKMEKTFLLDWLGEQVKNSYIEALNGRFSNFEEFAKEWNKQYQEAMAAGNTKTAEALLGELDSVFEQLMEQTEEVRKRLKKLEAETTFTNMSSNFVSALMDMDKDADEWGKEIGRTLAQRIIEQTIMAERIEPLMKELQEAFNNAINKEGATWENILTDESIAAALEKIKAAYPELQKYVEQIMETLGVNSIPDSLGDLRGSFISMYLDMEADAEEFGKSIATTLMEQMLDTYIEKQYKDKFDELNRQWAEALENNDTLAMERIRQAILDLYAIIGKDEEVVKLSEHIKKLSQEADTTFKNMGGSFTSFLLDAEADAEAFGKSIGQTLVQNLVQKLIVEKHLQKYFDDIQKAYNDAINDGLEPDAALRRVLPLIDKAIDETEQWRDGVQELAKRFQDLSTPIDSLRDKFLSELMDMKSDGKDFAKDINQILTQAFVDEFVLGDAFDKQLDEWKKKYKEINDNEGMSEEERAAALRQLQKEITNAKNGYIEETRKIQDLMAYGEYQDQDVTANMADKATYDQFETYLGIALDQQMALHQGNDVRQQILATLQAMSGLTQPPDDTLLRISAQIDTANNHLYFIRKAVESTNTVVLRDMSGIRNKLNMI